MYNLNGSNSSFYMIYCHNLIVCLTQTVDAKLSSRQEELCHMEQQLDKMSKDMEEIADAKQHPQFAKSDLQKATAKTVTTVCHQYHLSITLILLTGCSINNGPFFV